MVLKCWPDCFHYGRLGAGFSVTMGRNHNILRLMRSGREPTKFSGLSRIQSQIAIPCASRTKNDPNAAPVLDLHPSPDDGGLKPYCLLIPPPLPAEFNNQFE